MNRIDAMRRGLTDGRNERDIERPHADQGLDEVPISAFAASHNAAALALYQHVSKGVGNRVFSPLSVRMALAMAWAGARGDTAVQMARALHFDPQAAQVHAGFSALLRRLAQLRKGGEGLTMANSLWAQAGATLRPEFLELVDQFYGGGVNTADFRRDAGEVRRRINDWVGRETDQKIRELMGPNSIGPDTRLALVNACSFLGKWVTTFPAENTSEQPFYLEDGSQTNTPLMCVKSMFRLFQSPDFAAVEMLYQRCGMSMVVVLPKARAGLPALEAGLSAGFLDECVSQMDVNEATVFLPRFKIRWSDSMNGPLRALGMADAFEPGRADFSGINGSRPPQDDALAISEVQHEAWIETDEQGTRAAAATGGGMTKCLPATFRADHPFLFAIRGVRSGVIWFLGRVADPTRE